MTEAAVWSIVLPLGLAAVAFLAGRRSSPWLAVAGAAGALVAAMATSLDVYANGPKRYELGGWGAPLGIDLYADGLSCLMLLTTSSIVLLLSVYALPYLRAEAEVGGWSERRAYAPLCLFLLAALNSLFLSADLFNLYVALELLTLAGVALVVTAGGREALTAAMRYLLAAFAASLLYLLGVVLLYGQYGVLDLHLLAAAAIADDRSTQAALVLVTAGLMVKTALFPFHAWLPQAHSAAPTPVSAMLSGLVIKASFYLVLRLWVETFPGAVSVSAGQAVGVLAALGIVWGSLQALRVERVKLIVAHSTVAQVGYLFLVLPLVFAADATPERQMDAWSGGAYQILSHAFAKAALFLCAGTVLYAFGNDRIDSMRGLSQRLPMTAFAFGIAGVALIGLPPSGNFVAKWLLLRASLAADPVWVVVITIGTLLSGAYVFRVLRAAFATEGDAAAPATRVPREMEVVSLVLAVVALLLGLRATEPLALLEVGSPFREAP